MSDVGSLSNLFVHSDVDIDPLRFSDLNCISQGSYSNVKIASCHCVVYFET